MGCHSFTPLWNFHPETSAPRNKYHRHSYLSWQQVLLSQIKAWALGALSCFRTEGGPQKTILPALQEDSCLTKHPRRSSSKSLELNLERKGEKPRKNTPLHSCPQGKVVHGAAHVPETTQHHLRTSPPRSSSILLTIWWKRRVLEGSSQTQGVAVMSFLFIFPLSEDKHEVFGYLAGFFLLDPTLPFHERQKPAARNGDDSKPFLKG